MNLSELTKLTWSPEQQAVIHAPLHQKIFYQGPAGAGKTTAGTARLAHLIHSGVAAESLLVLVPQRTLGEPYYAILRDPALVAGGVPNIATVGGLARRMVDLFWPLVAQEAGFTNPENRPIFLTLETAQYYMARVIDPLIEEFGYFESITINRNRLFSQIIDNLNKAAVVGFPVSEISSRLSGAWIGEQAHTRVYDHAQICALAFRRYCLEHNLLDFSLQVAIFFEHLWSEPLCRDYIQASYRHLIYDNIEEDTPVAHDLVFDLVRTLDSALVIYDEQAGYRQFLGADAEGALLLGDVLDKKIQTEGSFVVSPALTRFGDALAGVLIRSKEGDDGKNEHVLSSHTKSAETGKPALMDALKFQYQRYHPQMLDWVTEEISALVHEQDMLPSDIVIIAPFLSDALRFSLTHRLSQAGIKAQSHRPSRALRDEPVTQAMLTLASLAHPGWNLPPTRYDVAFALMHAIADLDLVRAQLLSQIVYRIKGGTGVLMPFEDIKPDMQERITYVLGNRYEGLRQWLTQVQAEPQLELDYFLSRLFGELMSIPGFGFHNDPNAGQIAALLIESVRKFRWISADLPSDTAVGEAYVRLVQQGVIASQYLVAWQEPEEDAVRLSPAYTFLLTNRPVRVQFWLNVGGSGWWERLYQPLTHPAVLSRRWPAGKPWTDEDEMESRQTSLYNLVLGLIRRCREKVYLGLSELGEEGYEQKGVLLGAIQRVLRQYSKTV
ncbi:MAG: hypothetical protein P1S60_12335, partial [Anaerolineae bacterium]|nr:hypothetical protein [Anaerolineae bacterium]